jgi:hypothetical protein
LVIGRPVTVLRVLFCILLLATVSLCGIWAQERSIITRVDPNPVAEGRWVTIVFYIGEVQELSSVEAPQTAESLIRVRGPDIRPFFASPEEVTFDTGTRVSYSYKANQSGRFIMGPFRFHTPDGTVRSEPFIIEVGNVSGEQIVVPLQVRWKLAESEVSVGEPFTATLVVENEVAIHTVSEVELDPPEGYLFEKISPAADITVQEEGAVKLFSIPAAAYMGIPMQTGKVTLPSAVVIYGGKQGKAPRKTIEAVPLPDELGETAAVGNFTFSARIERTRKQGETRIVLHETVSGTGNFPLISLPEPRFPGLERISEQEERNYQAGPAGFHGSLQHIHVFRVQEKQGTISVPVFTWFDPEKDGIEESREYSFGPFQSGNGTADGQRVPSPLPESLQPLPVEAVRGFAMIDEAAVSAIQQGNESFRAGKYASALKAFRDALRLQPHHPGINYNVGITLFTLNTPDEAVYRLRKALFLQPASTHLREAVTTIEEELDLSHQIGKPLPVHPRLSLILFIVMAGGSLLFFILWFVRRRRFFLPLLVLSSFLFIASLTGHAIVSIKYNRQWGVTKTGSIVKKIPRDSGSDWFELPGGTAVFIEHRSDTYFFIETGTDISGWLKKSALFLDHRTF